MSKMWCTGNKFEEKQVEADVVMVAMQNIEEQQMEHENLHQHVQQNMHHDMEGFDEDSLASSDAEQATSEITCLKYLKQFEMNHASRGSVVEPQHHSESNEHSILGALNAEAGHSIVGALNAEATSFISANSANKYTYVWKVVHKRDMPGQSLNIETGY